MNADLYAMSFNPDALTTAHRLTSRWTQNYGDNEIPQLHHYWLPLFMLVLVGCGGGSSSGEATHVPLPEAFTNPQRVTILDYNDHAMEPALSRDGQYLFFNNSNAAVNTNLHWAERVDDLTFQYRGEIGGVNTTALEGVASMDRNNVFYFVSTQSYATTLSTLYRGTFTNGAVSGVELVPGVSALSFGMVNFDADISPDGNTLYFVDGLFNFPDPVPSTADILIAERSGVDFVRVANGADIMRQINTGALEYAPTISASGLEIFFTRLEGSTSAIYASTRSNTLAPFDAPQRIETITGFVEAPTLSMDEKSLYYHKDENGLFVIYRVTRP